MRFLASYSNISEVFRKVIKGEMTIEEFRKVKIESGTRVIIIKDSIIKEIKENKMASNFCPNCGKKLEGSESWNNECENCKNIEWFMYENEEVLGKIMEDVEKEMFKLDALEDRLKFMKQLKQFAVKNRKEIAVQRMEQEK